MRTAIVALVLAAAIAVLAGAGFIYSGIYNIAATEPHWGVTHWVLETVRDHSIKARAAGIQVPPNLDEPAKLAIGVEHFAEHCAVCHGAPGVPKGDIAKGLYPQPPDLAGAAARYGDAELFWILKHGIKMTGMPGWPDHSDAELWATVAFLKKLPGMSVQDYAALVMAGMGHGEHHHPAGHADKPDGKP